MEITNGKVFYRTPSPFEAPASSVELVFTLQGDDDAELAGKGALAQARNIAESMGKDTQPAAKPATKRATAAEKKAAKAAKAAENKDPMADAEPASEPAKVVVEVAADPMADAPKADTKGGVVDLVADLDDEVISDAKLQEAVRKEAGRLTGKVVKEKMKDLYGKEQMSGIPNEKRAEFILILSKMEAGE